MGFKDRIKNFFSGGDKRIQDSSERFSNPKSSSSVSTVDPVDYLNKKMEEYENSPTHKNVENITRSWVVSGINEINGRRKQDYLKENKYAGTLEKLMRHFSSGVKLSGDENYVLTQYNFDKIPKEIQFVVFLPYLEELESMGLYATMQIPQSIEKEYKSYKSCYKTNDEIKESVENGELYRKYCNLKMIGFRLMKKIGIIDDIKDKSVFKTLSESDRKYLIYRQENGSDNENLFNFVTELPKDSPDNKLIKTETEMLREELGIKD